MKQEYIINDVVMYDNEIMVIKEPREECHFDLLWNNWIIYSYINIEEIKPVHLTPEILEKNGWNKEGKDGSDFSLSEVFMGGDEDDEDNFTCFQLYYQNKNDGWVIDMHGEPLKFEVHYVHELQHLLFGLGLNSEMKV